MACLGHTAPRRPAAAGHLCRGHQARRGAVREPGPPAQGTAATVACVAAPIQSRRADRSALRGSSVARAPTPTSLSSTAKRPRRKSWRRRGPSWRPRTLRPCRRKQLPPTRAHELASSPNRWPLRLWYGSLLAARSAPPPLFFLNVYSVYVRWRQGRPCLGTRQYAPHPFFAITPSRIPVNH